MGEQPRQPAYRDELDRPVYDLTEAYNLAYGVQALKVERCEGNLLALYRDGRQYEVVYKWLSDPADFTAVRGSEVAHFKLAEIDLRKGLFLQVQLF